MKNIPKHARDFAAKNDRRIFRFDITVEDGGEGEQYGSVKPEHCDEVMEMGKRMLELASK